MVSYCTLTQILVSITILLNKLVGLDLDDNSTFELTPTYDDAGNMREHPINSNTKYRYTHDLWNRLVKVEIEKGGSWFDVSEYEYFGTHWRSVKRSDTNTDQTLDEEREMYYTAGWQLIEERIDDDYINNAGIDRNMQYLWGGRYIDDIIMHREDTNGDGDFTDNDDTRWWHLTDVQFSTIAILDDAANVAERVKYDSYGRALHHDWRDVDGDRDYDSTDRSIISSIAILLSNKIGDASYRAEADLNRDGTIDSNDLNLATTNYNAALSSGELSNSDVKNTIGWDGYIFNPEIASAGLYTVRFRTYSPDAGRWLERDPLDYVDGSNFYQMCQSNSIKFDDPIGLDSGVHPATQESLHPHIWTWESLERPQQPVDDGQLNTMMMINMLIQMLSTAEVSCFSQCFFLGMTDEDIEQFLRELADDFSGTARDELLKLAATKSFAGYAKLVALLRISQGMGLVGGGTSWLVTFSEELTNSDILRKRLFRKLALLSRRMVGKGAFRVGGKFIPYVGMGLLIWDCAEVVNCIVACEDGTYTNGERLMDRLDVDVDEPCCPTEYADPWGEGGVPGQQWVPGKGPAR